LLLKVVVMVRLALLFLVALLPACGSYETVKIKHYKLAVLSDDPAMKAEFAGLIDDFNDYAGMHVLSYVDSADDANSSIILTKGLESRAVSSGEGSKVGYGQWMSETRTDSPLQVGSRPKRTITFAMRVEFDLDYMKERMQGVTSAKTYDKQKLFFHEVGHGLELNHNEQDPTDLMYPEISGTKDFDRFFRYVRSYMADSE
jgi:hypothetical protein